MNPLEQKIIEKIKKEGPITFEAFMEMALYYPELGYYASPETTIGRKGDFYTSPHLHPVFGAMLGTQLMEMWIVTGKPPDFYVIEIGAGAGYLCKDILDYLNKLSENTALSQDKSDFLKSLRYVIVEPCTHLQEKQKDLLVSRQLSSVIPACPESKRSMIPDPRQARTGSAGMTIQPPRHYKVDMTLGGDKEELGKENGNMVASVQNSVQNMEKITWVRSLKEFNGGIKGCIFSNELLDAFPVHLVEMEDGLKEIYVGFDGREIVEQKQEVSSKDLMNYTMQFSLELQEEYRTEINLRMRSWLEEITAILSEGFLITIDYGYSAKEYYNEERTRGTLLCYHKHQVNEDPYKNIGEQDITAHVNFSSLKRWGEEVGLKTIGYCPQGIFLIASGIDEVITELYSSSPDYLFEISKIKGLILPQGMGESHKIMIQYKGEGLPELRGFSMRNKAGSL